MNEKEIAKKKDETTIIVKINEQVFCKKNASENFIDALDSISEIVGIEKFIEENCARDSKVCEKNDFNDKLATAHQSKSKKFYINTHYSNKDKIIFLNKLFTKYEINGSIEQIVKRTYNEEISEGLSFVESASEFHENVFENISNELSFNEKSDIFEVQKTLLYQVTSEFLDWKILSVYNNVGNVEYTLTDCSNYTYIMYDRAHETIKIGTTSNNPGLRLNQLKTANPSIEMIHVFPGILHSEKGLHQKFDYLKKDREWFFNAKPLKDFLSIEKQKHEVTIEAYKKRRDLDEIESKLFDIHKLNQC